MREVNFSTSNKKEVVVLLKAAPEVHHRAVHEVVIRTWFPLIMMVSLLLIWMKMRP
jgi:hypothetical protein